MRVFILKHLRNKHWPAWLSSQLIGVAPTVAPSARHRVGRESKHHWRPLF